MKNANKLIAIIMIAFFAINFIACDSDEENQNTKPPIEEYPLQVSTKNLPCQNILDWGLLREHGKYKDTLFLINNKECFDKYITFNDSIGNCQIDFSKKTVLLAYTWTRNLRVSEVFDTLWKLSPNDYRWNITYKYNGIVSPEINELANIIIIPKISDTTTILLYVKDGHISHTND